jgi:hypothetical protein
MAIMLALGHPKEEQFVPPAGLVAVSADLTHLNVEAGVGPLGVDRCRLVPSAVPEVSRAPGDVADPRR